MSDPSSTPSPTGTESTGPAKKKVSPARNLIGIVVLIAVTAVAALQYATYFRYAAATKALDARATDEEKAPPDLKDTDGLLGKSPDGPGSDYEENGRQFNKKTYTWQGPLKSYTLTAYFMKFPDLALHHFEPDGTKYVAEPMTLAPTAPISKAAGGKKARGKRKGAGGRLSKNSAKSAPDPGKANAPTPAGEPSKPAAAQEPAKAAEPTSEPSKNTAAPAKPTTEPSNDAAAPAKPTTEPPKDTAAPAPAPAEKPK